MSPGYRVAPPLSPRDDKQPADVYSTQQTPRYVSSLGKNAYALAFGSSDLSKILLSYNSGSKQDGLNVGDLSGGASFYKEHQTPGGATEGQ